MISKFLICTDSSRQGKWIDIELPADTTQAQIQQLLTLHGEELRLNRVSDGIQIFCGYGQEPAKLIDYVYQLIADAALRDRISERCVIKLDDLVGGVLCEVLKV